MKKVLTAILISICAAATASAGIVFQQEEDDYPVEKSISIQPTFGLKEGKIGEYVFIRSPAKASDTGSTPDDTLSYLEWQMSPEYVLGLNLEGCFKNLYLNAGMNFGIPAKCGTLADSDWQNINSEKASSATAEQQSWKTNYSESDNYLDYDVNLSAKAGYTFAPWWRMRIIPNIGVDYTKIKFTAKGGEYWYGTSAGTYIYSYDDSTSGHITSGKMSGTVLEYTREQFFLWTGFDVSFKTPFNLVITAGTQVAPYSYTMNIDNHPVASPKSYYADVCTGFFKAVKAGLGLSYQFTPHFSATLDSTILYLGEIRGKSYQKIYGASGYTELTGQQGGADAFTVDVALGCKYTFF